MDFKEEYSVKEVAEMLHKTPDDIRHLIGRKKSKPYKLSRTDTGNISRESVEKYILENMTINDFVNEIIPVFDGIIIQIKQKWHNFMENGLIIQLQKEADKDSF